MVTQSYLPKNISPPLKKIIRFVLLCALLMLPFLTQAKSLEVSSDRQTVELSDIITLTITADFQTRGSQLDLQNLEDQFEVLGRQQSNQMVFGNSGFSSKTQWKITLIPKKIGDLIIPSLQIEGVKSQPYQIKVLPTQQKSIHQFGNHFLESSLNKAQVYVQEEVLYSLKFYFLGAFQGNIRPPIFKDSLTTVLKDQAIYGKQVNNQQYTVYEWLYAVYPQKSGDLVVSAPIISGIQQYRNRTKGVQESAQAQTITVLPEPTQLKQNPNEPWLPAKAITLSETWDNRATTLRVGDSLSRTLMLNVTGLQASQLPTLSTENQAGFKMYGDQPIVEESTSDNGVRTQQHLKETLIFTQTGEITLPEKRIHWFNIQTQKMETAHLKSRTFTVLPALNAPNQNLPPPLNKQDVNSNAISTLPNLPVPDNVSRETSLTWIVISTLLALVWLATLIFYRNKVQRLKARLANLENLKKDTAHTKGGEKKPTQITLCQKDSEQTPDVFYAQLRETLKQTYGIHAFSELKNTELKQAINQLEKHLFYQETLPENTLNNICEWLPKEKKLTENKITSQLASLYK